MTDLEVVEELTRRLGEPTDVKWFDNGYRSHLYFVAWKIGNYYLRMENDARIAGLDDCHWSWYGGLILTMDDFEVFLKEIPPEWQKKVLFNLDLFKL